jgi:hypothetical protein
MYRTMSLAIAFLLFALTGFSEAETCNPYIRRLLEGAVQSGSSFGLMTLPNLGPLDSSDLDVGGQGRKIALLVDRSMKPNLLLAKLNQHRDIAGATSTIYSLTAFHGKDFLGFTTMDTFFAAKGDDATDVLSCNPSGSVPSPGCQHWMTYRTFTVKADYGRDWLPKWHDIRNTVMKAFSICNTP